MPLSASPPLGAPMASILWPQPALLMTSVYSVTSMEHAHDEVRRL
jgi:hypothetical protein